MFTGRAGLFIIHFRPAPSNGSSPLLTSFPCTFVCVCVSHVMGTNFRSTDSVIPIRSRGS